MDLRAVDASIMAARRIELDKVAPVTQKPKRLGDDHTESGDDEKHKSNVELDGDAEQGEVSEEANASTAAETEAGDAEHHILDVRV